MIKNLIICDKETEYASRLVAYLGGKRELALQVKMCNDPAQVEDAQRMGAVDILLIDESIEVPSQLLAEIPTVIRLSALAQEKEDSMYPTIYRYQRGSDLYTCLIEQLSKSEAEVHLGMHKMRQGKLIGVYSPVHRLGQTSFCIGKGMELSAEENVLYINLESYAGVGGYFPEEKEQNLSKLLYYAKQEMGSPGLLVTTLVKRLGELDYIPPVTFPDELYAVTVQEWSWILKELKLRSIYDVLILDIGEGIQGLFEILSLCDELYLPTAADPIAVAKLHQLEQAMLRQGYQEVWERMIHCDVRRTAQGKDFKADGSYERNRG